MRITVYASSSPRTPLPYLHAARALGRRCAEGGHVLVDGAGRHGCMGALNEACLAAGGRIEGVILRQFHEAGLGCEGLQDYLVVDTMRERKRLLAHGSDAYLVLPGGPGTWEELWEIAVERQIGINQGPLVLIDCEGFYAGFRQQLARAESEGFLYGPAEALFLVADDVSEAFALITADQAKK